MIKDPPTSRHVDVSFHFLLPDPSAVARPEHTQVATSFGHDSIFYQGEGWGTAISRRHGNFQGTLKSSWVIPPKIVTVRHGFPLSNRAVPDASLSLLGLSGVAILKFHPKVGGFHRSCRAGRCLERTSLGVRCRLQGSLKQVAVTTSL